MSKITARTRWHVERAQAIHRICLALEARHKRGESYRSLFRKVAARCQKRFYRTAPGRPFRLPYGTINNLLLKWRKGGRTADTLLPRWIGSNRPKLSPDVLRAFIHAAVAGDARSFKAAWQRMAPVPVGTASAFHHALPCAQRQQLTRLFALRRQAQRLAVRIVRQPL